MSRGKTALLLLPPLLAIILFAPAWAFLLLAEVMALLGVRELFELAEPIGYRAFRSLAYLATLFLTASFYPGLPAPGWIVLAFVLTVGLPAGGRGGPPPPAAPPGGATILGPLPCGVRM